MEHKGCTGKVEFDDEAGIFYGELVNTRDIITFQGESVTELKKAFRDSTAGLLAGTSGDFRWAWGQGQETLPLRVRRSCPSAPSGGPVLQRNTPDRVG
jgi:hypothetical protein